MKRLTALLAAALSVLGALTGLPLAVYAEDAPTPENAASVVLYNFENDKTLLSYEADKRVYPASTVKLMTGIIAYEELGGDGAATITVSAEMLDGVKGNNIALREGEIVTVSDMLHALLVNGANDAAQVLAVAVSGSVESFVTRMNQKAQLLGAYSTYYTNPTGMHSDAMVTTAHDTAVIARYAYRLDGFTDITSQTKYVMERTNKSDYRNLFNRNSQLSKFYDTRYYYPAALGMNAGYTQQGGYCLVSAARRDELSYLCVVMDAGETEDGIYSYLNANRLLDWAFDAYGYTEVLSAQARICELPVSLSSTVDYVTLVPAGAIVRYLPTELDAAADLHISYNTYEESLTAPVEAGQVCGFVTVTYGDEILGSVDLVSSSSVTRSEFLYLLERIQAFTRSRFFRASVVFAILFGAAYIIFEARRREKKYRRRF